MLSAESGQSGVDVNATEPHLVYTGISHFQVGSVQDGGEVVILQQKSYSLCVSELMETFFPCIPVYYCCSIQLLVSGMTCAFGMYLWKIPCGASYSKSASGTTVAQQRAAHSATSEVHQLRTYRTSYTHRLLLAPLSSICLQL